MFSTASISFQALLSFSNYWTTLCYFCSYSTLTWLRDSFSCAISLNWAVILDLYCVIYFNAYSLRSFLLFSKDSLASVIFEFCNCSYLSLAVSTYLILFRFSLSFWFIYTANLASYSYPDSLFISTLRS